MTRPTCPFCRQPLRPTYWGKVRGWSCPCSYHVRAREEGEAVTEDEAEAVGEELRS